MGASCAAGRCVGGALSGPSFQINALDVTNCRVQDHSAITGDDRGGIGISSVNVFYSGDSATGRFDLETLAGASIGRVADAMLSDLRTGTLYTLANGTTPITNTGGSVTSLIVLDGTSGAVTSSRVSLSQPITVGGTGRTGIFSGWGRAVILAGGRGYHIELPSGAVIDLGSVSFPTASTCENWAVWGVAEYFGGALYVDSVQNSTTINRTRIPDGVTTPLGRFTNLSDMCSFTVQPSLRRWYFHHEYSGQFGGSGETIGYCDAGITAEGLACPSGTTMCGARCVDTQRESANCGACGNACGTGTLCVSGTCRALTRYVAAPAPSEVVWVDVCGAQRILANVDDSSQRVAIPFAFPYWGTMIAAGSMVNVSTNGFISLNDVAALNLSGSIPATSTPNATLAPQWRDLVMGSSGICVGAVGAAPNRRWVVQWSNVTNFPSSGDLSFEVILNESSGAIDFVYGTMSGALSATVGIENPTGTVAVGACGATTCTISSNTRIRFSPDA